MAVLLDGEPQDIADIMTIDEDEGLIVGLELPVRVVDGEVAKWAKRGKVEVVSA